MRKLVALGIVVLLIILGAMWPERVADIGRSLQPQLTIISDIDSVRVGWNESMRVADILGEQDFFGDGKVTLYSAKGRQMGSVTVRKLRVVLVDAPQVLGRVYGEEDKKMYQSWGVEYVSTLHSGVYDLRLLLHVDPATASGESDEELWQRYWGQMLLAIWDLTHPKIEGHEGLERLEGSLEWVREYVDENQIKIRREESRQ